MAGAQAENNECMLHDLFHIVLIASQQYLSNGGTDGMGYWQPVKKIFARHDDKLAKWSKLDGDLVDRLMKIPEHDADGKFIPVQHFLRQQVRIPTEEDCNIRRFMQLALNAGQLLGSTTQKERQNFGYSMSLADPNTYLDSDSRAIFSKLITKEDVKAVKEYYNRDYELKTGTGVKSKPKPKPKSGVKSKPKPKPKPKSGVKSKPKPKPKPKSKK